MILILAQDYVYKNITEVNSMFNSGNCSVPLVASIDGNGNNSGGWGNDGWGWIWIILILPFSAGVMASVAGATTVAAWVLPRQPTQIAQFSAVLITKRLLES